LKLQSPPGKHDGQDRGSIVICFVAQNAEKVGADAIVSARTAAENRGVSRTADLADSKGISFQEKMDPGSLADSFSAALGSVVQKLTVLTQIIDDVAKVRKYNPLIFIPV
jgi:hypothetical protein